MGGSAKRLSTKHEARIQCALATGASGRAYPERDAAVGLMQLIINPLIYYLGVVGRLKESESAT